MEVEFGDVYGVVPPPSEGYTTLSSTITISVPWVEMNFIDEYTLQLMLDEATASKEGDLADLLSNTLGYDLEANDVKVGFVVIITPPTSMPTGAPTTAAAFNAYKRVIRIRSWGFITLFWAIVLCCFSLENGLCACRRFGKRREEYAGVELGTGGFD